MSETLSEEDMRQALFGGADQRRSESESGASQTHTKPTLSPAPWASSRSLSSRLRVTMRAEGLRGAGGITHSRRQYPQYADG